MILTKVLKMATIKSAGKDVAVVQWVYGGDENTEQVALGLGSQSQQVP